MLTPSETDASADAEVRWVDQQQINEFGRLNRKRQELKEELAEVEKRLANLSDAEEGVMMADESEPGATKLLIGESFVDCDSAAALDYINSALEADKAAKERLAGEMKALAIRMGELKAVLYARFGKSINLEDPAETA